jgi:hypothetical protein
MATYADRAAIADDPVFKSRVKVALVTAAILNGLNPKQEDESDTAFKMRVSFSIDVMFGHPSEYLDSFTNGLIWNSDLIPNMVDVPAAAADLTAAGDAQIQAAVNAVFMFRVKVWWIQ